MYLNNSNINLHALILFLCLILQTVYIRIYKNQMLNISETSFLYRVYITLAIDISDSEATLSVPTISTGKIGSEDTGRIIFTKLAIHIQTLNFVIE